MVVFGRDFRQVLSVLSRATKQEIIYASSVMSYLWPLFIKIELTQNMRANNDSTFSDFFIPNWQWKREKNEDDNIKLPHPMIIPYKDDIISLQ